MRAVAVASDCQSFPRVLYRVVVGWRWRRECARSGRSALGGSVDVPLRWSKRRRKPRKRRLMLNCERRSASFAPRSYGSSKQWERRSGRRCILRRRRRGKQRRNRVAPAVSGAVSACLEQAARRRVLMQRTANHYGGGKERHTPVARSPRERDWSHEEIIARWVRRVY